MSLSPYYSLGYIAGFGVGLVAFVVVTGLLTTLLYWLAGRNFRFIRTAFEKHWFLGVLSAGASTTVWLVLLLSVLSTMVIGVYQAINSSSTAPVHLERAVPLQQPPQRPIELTPPPSPKNDKRTAEERSADDLLRELLKPPKGSGEKKPSGK